jgi:hypothetical protein
MSMSNALAVTLLAVTIASAWATYAAMSPEERSQVPVSYVSGGIGDDQAEAMRQASTAYPLTVEMASAAGGPRDAYVSNAKVDIWDASGKDVLDITTEGPLLLVKLPARTYRVAVNWNGTQRDRTVVVGAGHQHVMLEFPNAPTNN